MASGDIQVTVAVEMAIHRALAEVVQTILRQHRVRIEHATFNWLEVTTASDTEKQFIVARIGLFTTTDVKQRPA